MNLQFLGMKENKKNLFGIEAELFDSKNIKGKYKKNNAAIFKKKTNKKAPEGLFLIAC